MTGTKQSWNNSGKHKSGILTRFKCNYCGKQYKQSWTKEIHERRCEERQ